MFLKNNLTYAQLKYCLKRREKHMKKIISILLGVILIFSTVAFVGCNADDNDSKKPVSPSGAEESLVLYLTIEYHKIDATHKVVYESLDNLHAYGYSIGNTTGSQIVEEGSLMSYQYLLEQPGGESELIFKVKKCAEPDDLSIYSHGYFSTSDGNTLLNYDYDLSQLPNINAAKPGIYTSRLVFKGWEDYTFTVTIEILE